MATATKTCVNAAVAGVLSERDGIFTFKGEKRMEPKAFLSGHHVFALLPTSSHSIVEQKNKEKVPSNVPGYWLKSVRQKSFY